MNKVQFFSSSLPYKLKILINNNEAIEIKGVDSGSVTLFGINDFIEKSIKYSIPIIRHPDTLTKECVQADYNNGEPFRPLTSLAHNFRDYEFCYYNEKKILGIKHQYFNDSFMFLSDFEKLNQLLLSWHFWPNMPEGEEVMYVTEEFNPYK